MYVPHAVDLDGTNDYYLLSSDLTGNTDNKTFLTSFWLYPDASDTHVIYHSAGDGNLIWVGTNGAVNVWAENAAGTRIVAMAASAPLLTAGSWHHVCASVDLGATTGSMYINGTAATLGTPTYTDDDIDHTKAAWAIGAKTNGADPTNGKLAEFFWTNEYLDLTAAANLRKFITSALKPEDPGADGSTPTGTAPLIYYKFLNTAVATNSGSGGDFTETGAPAKATGPVLPGWMNASTVRRHRKH